MGILEKISEIEKEIARTQKNKGFVVFFFRHKRMVHQYNFVFPM